MNVLRHASERVVVDACVFAKLFLDEADATNTRAWLSALTERATPILVPSLFIYEIYHIATKYPIDLAFLDTLLAQYQAYNLKVVAPSRALIEQTQRIIAHASNTAQVSFYDASYHAIAMLHDCDFITADRAYYKRCHGIGHIHLLADII